MALPEQKYEYTTDYIISLPDGERAELIDGIVYDILPPLRIHQKLVALFTTLLNGRLSNYMRISIGTNEKMKKMLEFLKEYLEKI